MLFRWTIFCVTCGPSLHEIVSLDQNCWNLNVVWQSNSTSSSQVNSCVYVVTDMLWIHEEWKITTADTSDKECMGTNVRWGGGKESVRVTSWNFNNCMYAILKIEHIQSTAVWGVISTYLTWILNHDIMVFAHLMFYIYIVQFKNLWLDWFYVWGKGFSPSLLFSSC